VSEDGTAPELLAGIGEGFLGGTLPAVTPLGNGWERQPAEWREGWPEAEEHEKKKKKRRPARPRQLRWGWR
jgi:hypothetical protein